MNGERRISVSAARLPGWLQRYRDNHPDTEVQATPDEVVLTSPDGARAALTVPFPPLAAAEHPASGADAENALLEHLQTSRLIGVVLARRGGYAVGLTRDGALIESKIGGGYVQGRTKAGGWSQQRFARRRSNQADQVFGSAADVVVRLLLPHQRALDAVVLGGHRDGTDAVLADPRLAPLRPLVQPGVIDTPDPRLRVLTDVVGRLTDVTIRLNSLA